MGLHLLNSLTWQLMQTTVLGTDNQVVIKALGNQKSHAGQYILDATHKSTEQLNAKQDQLINCIDRNQVLEAGMYWVGRKREVIDLQIHWVPGH